MVEEFIEEIENQTKTGFYVTNIPRGELRRFKKLCREEYGDVYFVGIIQLMKIKEKYEEIIPLFSKLFQEIEEIKKELNFVKNKHKQIKTFG